VKVRDETCCAQLRLVSWIEAGEAKFTAIRPGSARICVLFRGSAGTRGGGTIRATTWSMTRDDIIAAAGWLGFLAALIAAASSTG
jgi:hypothetical protein